MSRKLLSPEAIARLHERMRQACERMEQQTGLKATDEEKELMVGVLAALDEQPREA